MHYEANWSTPVTREVGGARTAVARLAQLYGVARRMARRIANFYRELDRGWTVMHGQRPPDQPSPAELDILARNRVIRPPRHDD